MNKNINSEKNQRQGNSVIRKLFKVYSALNKEEFPAVKAFLSSKGISLDKEIGIEGKILISFTLDMEPDSSILTCSKSRWIMDEYNEIELYDGTGSGEFKFSKAIFYRNSLKNISMPKVTEDLDSLIQLYPVHYGNIRIEELTSRNTILKPRINKIDNSLSSGDLKERPIDSKQHWATSLALLKKELNQNLEEIRFIRELWENLNREFYGYDDEDLSLRYRGIDELSPLSNL